MKIRYMEKSDKAFWFRLDKHLTEAEFDKKARDKMGYGKALMSFWEEDMKRAGYGMVMASTQVDESAQHFYRKLGYRDAGGFIISIPGYQQPMEMIMIKEI